MSLPSTVLAVACTGLLAACGTTTAISAGALTDGKDIDLGKPVWKR